MLTVRLGYKINVYVPSSYIYKNQNQLEILIVTFLVFFSYHIELTYFFRVHFEFDIVRFVQN